MATSSTDGPALATEPSEGSIEMDPAPECGTGSLSRAFVSPCQLGRRLSVRDEPPWADIVRTYQIDSAAQPPPTFCRSGYGTCSSSRHVVKFMDGIFNLAASFVVAGGCVCNSEALLGCMITVFSMLLYWEYGQALAVEMNWNIVSLAVIFPITQGIGWGFRRRELALRDLSELLGCCRSVWEAVFTWQIQVVKDKETKARVWVRCVESFDDQEQATTELHQLWHSFLAALITYFDVARGGRARHTVGWHADEQAALIMTLREQVRPTRGDVAPCIPLLLPTTSCSPADSVWLCFACSQRSYVDANISQMRRLIQDLKLKGLPGGEAHRIDNYINMMGMAFERLTAIKEYRTPRAFRSFARVYILLVGAMYGPDYLALARGADGDGENLGEALVYACLIQLVMAGLFNVMLGLEDAFARRGGRGQLDSVKVPELVEVTRRQLMRIEREAGVSWGTPAARDHWHSGHVHTCRSAGCAASAS